MLIDTHAHIYNNYYKNIKEVIKNSKDNGVNVIINASTSFDDFDELIYLAKKYKELYYTLGIHPEAINELNLDYKEKLEKNLKINLKNKKLVAIGEIGLDYHYDNLDKEKQKEVFSFQLFLAEKYKMPVIIHSRDATNDTINILKEYNLKGIIHCYSGSLETAKKYIDLGYKFGIGGLVTFKNCNLKNYIKKIGLENIVLETDSPYMTPEPFRKFKNEPKYIKTIAEYLSNIFDENLCEIEKITTKNVFDIFNKLSINDKKLKYSKKQKSK